MTNDHEDNLIGDDQTEVGYIRISVVMGPDGLGTAFTLDGMSPETAIGHLIVVTDRLREDRSLSWSSDELDFGDLICPHCGESMIDDGHDHDDDEGLI